MLVGGPAPPSQPAQASDRRLRTSGLRGRARGGVGWQQHGALGLLAEVEIRDQGAENPEALANVRARVRPAVGAGVQARPVHEDVLDELFLGVERPSLLIDTTLP